MWLITKDNTLVPVCWGLISFGLFCSLALPYNFNITPKELNINSWMLCETKIRTKFKPKLFKLPVTHFVPTYPPVTAVGSRSSQDQHRSRGQMTTCIRKVSAVLLVCMLLFTSMCKKSEINIELVHLEPTWQSEQIKIFLLYLLFPEQE